MRYLIVLLLLVLVSPLWADIDVPEEITSPPAPIIAVVDADIPSGAESKGRWEIESEGGAKANIIEASDYEIYIWAEPGTYTISFRGMWVDFDNKQFDFIDETAELVVKADGDGPGPDPPPPPPPGDKQIVMFYNAQQLDNLPQAQRSLLTSLVVHRQLKEMGHVVLAVLTEEAIREDVSEEYASFAKAVMGDPLPRIAFASKEGGKVEDHPLPEDYDALVELLGGGE